MGFFQWLGKCVHQASAADDRHWQKIDMTIVPGMESLDIRVHIGYCRIIGDAEATKLSQFFVFASNFFCRLGGALPLIVKGELSDDRWQADLEDAVHHHRYVNDLATLLECLKDTPNYLFGDLEEASHIDISCEGNMTLTLAPSDFPDSRDPPNIESIRMLIHVQGLDVTPVSDMANVNNADVVLGRERVFNYEMTNGLRRVTMISKVHDSFKLEWVRNGDHWCISLIDAFQKQKVATPPKLTEHRNGKRRAQFCVLMQGGRGSTVSRKERI